MTKRLFYVAFLGLLAPGRLGAQDSKDPAQVPSFGGAIRTDDRRQMAEDVEIMRRLLGRALARPRQQGCASCHHSKAAIAADGSIVFAQSFQGGRLSGLNACPATRPTRALAFSPDGRILATGDGSGTVRLWDAATGKLLSTEGSLHIPDLEGVYLKGYGVVYTVTLPPTTDAPKAAPVKPAAKRLSEWERVRREIRGKPGEEAVPLSVASPSLAEILLHVLATNGRHFSQLGEKEKVTVVVTFREPDKTPGPVNATKPGLMGPGPAGAFTPDLGFPMGPGPSTSGGPPGMMMPGGVGKKPPSSARDYELVGDLSLKQNRAPEAVKAYASALNALAHELPASNAQRRTLYRKLAQAYLGLADPSSPASLGGTDKVIAQAIEFLRRASQKPKEAEPAPAPTAAKLPAQLIVSAPKALLDQIGASKLTFEEFRRAASVESVPAPVLSRPPAGRGK